VRHLGNRLRTVIDSTLFPDIAPRRSANPPNEYPEA
jgi:hypothetical protein